MNNENSNKKYMSPASVWALSFGSAVGWGAFVMPGTTFIPIAGPLGTAIGMALGAFIMLLIGANYHFMLNHYGEDGGTYSYTKHVFGYDHAFLSAWFLSLTYIAITWANVTALALIARNIFGSVFQFGFHYWVAGYTIYFGEVLLEIGVLTIVALLCVFAKKTTVILQTVFAFVLILGILYCFFACSHSESLISVFKYSVSAQKKPASQILAIAALSPWAFIGFESVSHSTQEFRFPLKKTFLFMAIAVFTGFVAYTALTLIAVPAYGLVSMPVFFVIKNYVGNLGFTIIGFAIMGGILTGIIGNSIAASRLLLAMANDGILPKIFKKTGSNGVPKIAILFITITSVIVTFLGRTAIGWIVDVTTIGASIAYGYTSATAFKIARKEGNIPIMVTGIIGLASSVFFSLFLLVPNFWSLNALAPESYIVLAFWSVAGFLYFRFVFTNDEHQRFGKTTVVWIFLLFVIFFTSIMWMRQATHKTAESVLDNISNFYAGEMTELGVNIAPERTKSEQKFLGENLNVILDSLLDNSIVQLVMILIALGVMFSVYSRMQNKAKTLEEERLREKRANEAKTAFLSNMSHDIRTPINAIIGFTNLARRQNVTMEQVQEYLTKIDSSSKLLLALINDVLEMSRIESGKMELELHVTNLKELMEEVRDMFTTQMSSKNIVYIVDYKIKDSLVLCDKNRFNRVLLNLTSNAFKFTPKNGTVAVSLSEIGEPYKILNEKTGEEEKFSNFELRVKDNGIGMSKEFAEKVFDAFEREQTSTVSGIQGTGLGMAITKSIIDLMGGEIRVQSEKGEGTEFIISLRFKIAENVLDSLAMAVQQNAKESNEKQKENANAPSTNTNSQKIDFHGKRLLLVDDVEVNREIAVMILSEMGFEVETASDGKEAVAKVDSATAGHFDAILMDIQMPEMNGYEATKKIRELSDKEKAEIPIIAMTANAFEEDKKNAFIAGMNAHVSKPIDESKLVSVLEFVLK